MPRRMTFSSGEFNGDYVDIESVEGEEEEDEDLPSNQEGNMGGDQHIAMESPRSYGDSRTTPATTLPSMGTLSTTVAP